MSYIADRLKDLQTEIDTVLWFLDRWIDYLIQDIEEGVGATGRHGSYEEVRHRVRELGEMLLLEDHIRALPQSDPKRTPR